MTSWTKYDKLKLLQLTSGKDRISWKDIETAFVADPNTQEMSASQLKSYWHKYYKENPDISQFIDNSSGEHYNDFDREMVKTGRNNPDEFKHAPNTIPVIEVDARDRKKVVKLDLADIHAEAYKVYRNLFEKKIEQICHNNWITTIIGDFFDNSYIFGTQEEKKLRKNSMFMWFRNVLQRPAEKGLLKALSAGNHDTRDYKHTEWNHVRLLAEILNVDYFRTQAFIVYHVGNQTYTFLETHGWGGGRKIGSKLNKLEELADQYESIDGVIMGHHHKPVYHPTTKKVFKPQENSYSIKHIELMIVPGWINGATYALEKGMRTGAMKEFRLELDGEVKYIKIDVRSMWDLD
jgi:hypothetical protein